MSLFDWIRQQEYNNRIDQQQHQQQEDDCIRCPRIPQCIACPQGQVCVLLFKPVFHVLKFLVLSNP